MDKADTRGLLTPSKVCPLETEIPPFKYRRQPQAARTLSWIPFAGLPLSQHSFLLGPCYSYLGPILRFTFRIIEGPLTEERHITWLGIAGSAGTMVSTSSVFPTPQSQITNVSVHHMTMMLHIHVMITLSAN